MLEPIKILMSTVNRKEGLEKPNEDAFLGLNEKDTLMLDGPFIR